MNRTLTIVMTALLLPLVGCGEQDGVRSYTSTQPAGYDWPDTQQREASHEEGGMTWVWDVPEGWADAPELSEFHVADYRFPGVTEKLPGRLTVSVSMGKGGGIESNVKRWREQLYAVSATGKSPIDTVDQPVPGLTVVELAGQYQGPFLPTRLAGAILQVPDAEGGVYQTWFFKMVGDDQTVVANRSKMLLMVLSLRPQGVAAPQLPGLGGSGGGPIESPSASNGGVDADASNDSPQAPDTDASTSPTEPANTEAGY